MTPDRLEKLRLIDPDKFWSFVQREDTNHLGCWFWTRGRNQKGYGLFQITWTDKQRTIAAHHAAFWLAGGEVTDEKPWVLHHCGVRKCVNPSHLYAGDGVDNARDRERDVHFSLGEVPNEVVGPLLKLGFTVTAVGGSEAVLGALTAE